jgi:hypothetical protein
VSGMTLILLGKVITPAMYWMSMLITSVNVFIFVGILISYIWYKLGKQLKSDFFETMVVTFGPIVVIEILIIILPFIMNV